MVLQDKISPCKGNSSHQEEGVVTQEVTYLLCGNKNKENKWKDNTESVKPNDIVLHYLTHRTLVVKCQDLPPFRFYFYVRLNHRRFLDKGQSIFRGRPTQECTTVCSRVPGENISWLGYSYPNGKTLVEGLRGWIMVMEPPILKLYTQNPSVFISLVPYIIYKLIYYSIQGEYIGLLTRTKNMIRNESNGHCPF